MVAVPVVIALAVGPHLANAGTAALAEPAGQTGTEIHIRSTDATADATARHPTLQPSVVRHAERTSPRQQGTPEQTTTVRLLDSDPILRHLATAYGASGKPTNSVGIPESAVSVAPDDTFRMTGAGCRVTGPTRQTGGPVAMANRIRTEQSSLPGLTIRLTSHEAGPGPREAEPAREILAATRWETFHTQRIGPLRVVADDVSRLTIASGHSKLLHSQVDVSRAVVGDPSLCNVVRYSSREVLIAGKRAGTTRLTFWFADGRHPPVTCLLQVMPDLSSIR